MSFFYPSDLVGDYLRLLVAHIVIERGSVKVKQKEIAVEVVGIVALGH